MGPSGRRRKHALRLDLHDVVETPAYHDAAVFEKNAAMANDSNVIK